MANKKKQTSTLDKITKVVVWFMIIATLIGIAVPTIMTLSSFLNQ